MSLYIVIQHLKTILNYEKEVSSQLYCFLLMTQLKQDKNQL